MEEHSVETYRCIMYKNGFDNLPEEIVIVCENAVLISKPEDEFVIYSIAAWEDVENKISQADAMKAKRFRRYLYEVSKGFKSVENLAKYMWGFLKYNKSKYADFEELDIEMRLHEASIKGETVKNQVVSINIVPPKED